MSTEPRIDPSISPEDVAEMLTLLCTESKTGQSLFSLRVRGDLIEARLGVRKTPRHAHGTTLFLRKLEGRWNVDRRASWIT